MDNQEHIEPLWVGVTRPPMYFGVPQLPFIANLSGWSLAFIHTDNWGCWLGMVIVYSTLYAIVQYDMNFFSVLNKKIMCFFVSIELGNFPIKLFYRLKMWLKWKCQVYSPE